MEKERVLAPIIEASLYPRELKTAEARDRGRDVRLGVALSGGGIRSATISLGFFQGLARRGLASRIDFLSTVSGGGYFGGFFGHLFQREAQATKARGEPVPGDLADRILRDPASPSIRYLRENGRYLSPNGSGDLLAAASIAVRNWAAVIIVMGLLALLLLTVATMIRFAVVDRLPSAIAALQLAAPLNRISPFVLAAIIAVPLLATPPGWAYWLVRDNPQSDRMVVAASKWLAPVGAVVAGGWLLFLGGGNAATLNAGQTLLLVATIVATLTIARYLVSVVGGFGDPHRQRRHLSRGLTRALVVIGVLLAVGVVDSIGQWLASLGDLRGAGFVGGLVTMGALLRKRIVQLASRIRANQRPPLPTGVLLYAGAAAILVGFLAVLAAVPHLVAGTSALVPDASPLRSPVGWFPRLAWLGGVCALLVLAISRVWSFLNRSSLHAIYEARLRRAYLGASNPERYDEGDNRPPVTEPRPNDGMKWQDYDPSRFGGPIHLINVTVNETVDGRSQVEQRDRKGMGMAIGPAGVSVSRTHHALWETRARLSALRRLQNAADDVVRGVRSGVMRAVTGTWKAVRRPAPSSALADRSAARPNLGSVPFRVFPSVATPELLDVGQWIAISGGAVSTGLGARTNLALSLLVGFFNVRLGYWWMSGVNPRDRVGESVRSPVAGTMAWLRRQLPVQVALLDEWLARFPGVARSEWYLTDGGHFENLGAYELLRRRLPFIIVCDNEQDVDYGFDGLANLVRKARTDLDAEITFLSERELADDDAWPDLPRCIGALDALRRGRRALEPVVDPVTGQERLVNDGARTGLSLKHASLARVSYGSVGTAGAGAPSEGWLLYVKPTLDGDEPIDVLRYHTEHPDFPHESTADQFFAEAQWESYRKLGEHVALKIFGDTPPEKSWCAPLLVGERGTPAVTASTAAG